MAVEADTLRRSALVLVVIGLAWNLVEAVVAFWAGLQAGSVAMLAFGLDSIVELMAGGVLVWRLRTERDEEEAEAAERGAQRLLGLSFFFLAVYVVIHSGANLAGWLPEPQPSIAGVAIVVASAVVMTFLYVGKMRIATRMQSRALRAEAMESLFCDLQDLSILVGLGSTACCRGGGLIRWRPWYWCPFSSRKAGRTLPGIVTGTSMSTTMTTMMNIIMNRQPVSASAAAAISACARAGRRAARRDGGLR